MSDLRELYQELILDHGRNPRNCCACPEANKIKEGFNPLCGDKLKLYIVERDGVVEKVTFEGEGCAISMASASLMSDALVGKSITEVEALFDEFHDLVTKGDETTVDKDSLGKLAALAGVAEFPARVKCATLAWHTVKSALNNESGSVSTE